MNKTVREAIDFLYSSVTDPMACMVADLVYGSLVETLDSDVLDQELDENE